MKELIIIVLSILCVVPQYVRAENADNAVIDDCPKITLSSDVEKRAVEVADKVCDALAPNIDRSALTPVLLCSNLDRTNPNANGRKMISVRYMRGQDSYICYGVYDADKKAFIKHRKPSSVIQVELYLGTLEPAAIGTHYIMFFSPNYQIFMKNNPDFKMKGLTSDNQDKSGGAIAVD